MENFERKREKNQKELIIWAVDPTQDPKEAKNLIQELKLWADQLGYEVQPVSVFSRSIFSFPVKVKFPWTEKIEDMANGAVSQYLKKTRAVNFRPPKIIFIEGSSIRRMASAVARYAQSKNAQLIFANTRARKTWNPFRLGGFAEVLIALSKVPVLLLNPSSLPSDRIPSLLFPTDFSSSSKKALVKLEPWAKAFQSKILLFNQIETPYLYTPYFNSFWPNSTPQVEDMMKEIKRAREKKANAWSSDLKRDGIECELLIRVQRKTTGTDIVNIAKKHKVNLIALSTESGPLSQFVLGSVARDVLLQAKCPVLIFHQTTTTKSANVKNQVRPLQNRGRKSPAVTSTSIQTRPV